MRSPVELYETVISFQVAVPFGLVTVSVPVFAFAGTVTVSFDERVRP